MNPGQVSVRSHLCYVRRDRWLKGKIHEHELASVTRGIHFPGHTGESYSKWFVQEGVRHKLKRPVEDKPIAGYHEMIAWGVWQREVSVSEVTGDGQSDRKLPVENLTNLITVNLK